jgi:radical SAM protein with 4Fe4S-binding SPASM domain
VSAPADDLKGMDAVAVMGRRPAGDAVKTRLAATVGCDQALAVYRALLTGVMRSVEQATASGQTIGTRASSHTALFLALTPDRHPAAPLEPSAILADLGRNGNAHGDRWRVLMQQGAGLGQRLAGVFADLFARGAEAVVIVNSDSPALPPEYVHRSLVSVRLSVEVGRGGDASGRRAPRGGLVVGPAADGGYYLIGTDRRTWTSASRALTEILTATPMGTAAALAHTVRAAASLGVALVQLPLWIDVDVAADLPLMQRLTERPVGPQCTHKPAHPAGEPDDRTRDGARGEPLHGLREVYLHVTNRCGLACSHCYNRSSPRDPDELTTAEWKDAVRQCASLGASSFVFIGGDPFLRDDLFELIDHVTGRHRAKARFFFNSLITSDMATRLARAGHGRLRALVSVDGPPDVNDALRCPGNYDDAMESVKNLLAVGIEPVCNTVTLRPVLPALPELARLLAQASVSRLHLILPHERGGLEHDGDLVPAGAELLPAIRELQRVAGELGLEIDNFTAWRRRLARPQDFCACGCRDLAIDPFGSVHACTITCGDPAFAAGSLRERPLKTIWRESASLRLLRRAHARDRAQCAACPVVDACGGECWMQAHYAARRREEPAGYAAPFPYCDLVRPLFEELTAQAAVAAAPAAGTGSVRRGHVGQATGADVDYAQFDCI